MLSQRDVIAPLPKGACGPDRQGTGLSLEDGCLLPDIPISSFAKYASLRSAKGSRFQGVKGSSVKPQEIYSTDEIQTNFFEIPDMLKRVLNYS